MISRLFKEGLSFQEGPSLKGRGRPFKEEVVLPRKGRPLKEGSSFRGGVVLSGRGRPALKEGVILSMKGRPLKGGAVLLRKGRPLKEWVVLPRKGRPFKEGAVKRCVFLRLQLSSRLSIFSQQHPHGILLSCAKTSCAGSHWSCAGADEIVRCGNHWSVYDRSD